MVTLSSGWKAERRAARTAQSRIVEFSPQTKTQMKTLKAIACSLFLFVLVGSASAQPDNVTDRWWVHRFDGDCGFDSYEMCTTWIGFSENVVLVWTRTPDGKCIAVPRAVQWEGNVIPGKEPWRLEKKADTLRIHIGPKVIDYTEAKVPPTALCDTKDTQGA